MKKNQNNKFKNNSNVNGFIPNSLKFISSCIKNVSSNVRSAGASVAGSIAGDSEDHHKEQAKSDASVTSMKCFSILVSNNPYLRKLQQVLWACFDRLELGPSNVKRVLLLGYSNGFQVLSVEDASNVGELVSRRDGPVTFLQLQPIPTKSKGSEGFRASHPLLLVVAGVEARSSGPVQNGRVGNGRMEPETGNFVNHPTAVRFYSLKSHNYVHVLRFRSAVYMVRCSSRIVAVGLASQIYCFDALTLENKFSVLTYPAPQLRGQGVVGVNVGYGPMALGSRWLAYASNNLLSSNSGRLSPQNLSPSPGVSPSTSPGNGSLVARYAMESSKHLATGLINLGDMGYRTLSKYCHELLPEGASPPVSSNSSWKVGRVAGHSAETNPAGMVVIKDFECRAVVSQFRAHTSPLSALCFDPSGTLLVTASIYGNNINIFRIMPSSSQNGSDTQNYDWCSSHVHLYKLHRGVTSAVIQDICFSHYSQWIAIVSSRGTCHIFVLSPFGGETRLQVQNSYVDGPTQVPVLSVPWWSTSSFMINQQFSTLPPPPPITLSVVGRIKIGNSGWLDTVSTAASSATGKVSLPSGVVSAVFHNSVSQNLQTAPSKFNSLEHLLVYTSSGNVVQYKLLPSVGPEHIDSSLNVGAGSVVQRQEEESKVKAEPVQWWDVCRRADWPEREDCIYWNNLGGQVAADRVMDTSDVEYDDTGLKNLLKPHECSHWYLSNAEVQMKSGRTPIWQNSKIHFYAMVSHGFEDWNVCKRNTGGETEIEKIPIHEVEITRKDLLPVFDQFHRIHSDWSDDRVINRRYAAASNSYSGHSKFPGESMASCAKLLSPGSPRNSRADQADAAKSYPPTAQTMVGNDGTNQTSSVLDSSPPDQNSFCVSNGREIQYSSSIVTSEASNPSSNRSDLSMNIIDEGLVHEDMHDPVDFEQYFHEGYCKASVHDQDCELMEAVTDADGSNSPSDKERAEENGETDDMLGGIFAFSEEVEML